MNKRKIWIPALAVLLVLALMGGLLLRPGNGTAAYAIAEAEYPQMPLYPLEENFYGMAGSLFFNQEGYDEAWDLWRSDLQARRDIEVEGLEDFFAQSARAFLTRKPGENQIYSPLNVYMALAMLAELTDGESRGQIMALLGSNSVEALRRQAGEVWNKSYREDGVVTTTLANSLWLNENIDFVQDTMDTLAQSYYASSYRGKMGSEGFDKALQGWLNDQTGGLLEEQAGDVTLDPDAVLALASALCFKAKWRDEFLDSFTEKDLFHAPDGDVEAEFMHQGGEDSYFWGDNFAAVGRGFEEAGCLWFLLPDEGVSPEELDFLFTAKKSEWENRKYLKVNQTVPKFDVSSQMELEEGLRALGVTDVFDGTVSDFSPTARDSEGLFLSRATHAARVTIDEEGCEAAAFTVMMAAEAAPPQELEEMDFVLDRPFVFSITGEGGLPLFVGIVNHP